MFYLDNTVDSQIMRSGHDLPTTQEVVKGYEMSHVPPSLI
jgi:hypothetical protein